MAICLSMIVKNEAHCISRCLESVKKYIDYWIICDTGSTDNTEEIVKNCLKDIPGEFHKHEWSDFSTNRNLALSLSKDKADYTLVIDADDILIVEDPDILKNISSLIYRIKIEYGPITYYRIQLVNNCVTCKYVGVLHEYLEVPTTIQIDEVSGLKMKVCGGGDRSKDPEKYLKDAKVLEAALEKEPTNPRNTFYCAQSYKDCGQLEKSMEYYDKRSRMGGWIEEVFIASLEYSKIYEFVNKSEISKIESNYIRTFNLHPSRIESLTYLSVFCRKQNMFDKAYLYANIGAKIPYPKDGLFLENSCYTWKIFDELAVAAFYIGKFAEGAILNKKLLKEGFLPDFEVKRIEENLKYCQERS